jgi:hypothetical protein
MQETTSSAKHDEQCLVHDLTARSGHSNHGMFSCSARLSGSPTDQSSISVPTQNKCELGDSKSATRNKDSAGKACSWTPPTPPAQPKPCFLITDTSSTNPSRSASIQIDGCLLTCSSLINTQDLANSIDRKCRVIYPFLFFIFNLIYWSVICSIE